MLRRLSTAVPLLPPLLPLPPLGSCRSHNHSPATYPHVNGGKRMEGFHWAKAGASMLAVCALAAHCCRCRNSRRRCCRCHCHCCCRCRNSRHCRRRCCSCFRLTSWVGIPGSLGRGWCGRVGSMLRWLPTAGPLQARACANSYAGHPPKALLLLLLLWHCQGLPTHTASCHGRQEWVHGV